MSETVLGMTELQIQLFTAIGQVAVAAAIGVIALRQWLTARNKLKADLFDRRYRLYTGLIQSMNSITDGRTGAVDQMERLVVEAKWLFGEKVTKRLHAEVCVPFQRLAAEKNAARDWKKDRPDTKLLSEAHVDAIAAASNAAIALPKIVGPHLQLNH
ncbi:hypothetical protein [Stenotrophomonas sp. NRRL B-14846]|uniref:hypothetical protein n=1 Tax=Stenotrophomonas sp. NRRL B-14846 TaxID=3162882 RepID=UPI003D2BA073